MVDDIHMTYLCSGTCVMETFHMEISKYTEFQLNKLFIMTILVRIKLFSIFCLKPICICVNKYRLTLHQ